MGSVPLHVACRLRSDDVELLQSLFDCNPKTCLIVDGRGQTPLSSLLSSPRSKKINLSFVRNIIYYSPPSDDTSATSSNTFYMLRKADKRGLRPVDYLCRWILNNVNVPRQQQPRQHLPENSVLPNDHPSQMFLHTALVLFLLPAPETSFGALGVLLRDTAAITNIGLPLLRRHGYHHYRVMLLRNGMVRVLMTVMNIVQRKKIENKTEVLDQMLFHHGITYGMSHEAWRFSLGKIPAAWCEKMSQQTNDKGELPLHRLLRRLPSKMDGEIIQRIVKFYPPAMGLRDREGQYPLFRALELGFDFDVVRVILEAHPALLSSAEVWKGKKGEEWSGFCPLLLAAVNDAHVSVIYLLLRENPHVLHCC